MKKLFNILSLSTLPILPTMLVVSCSEDKEDIIDNSKPKLSDVVKNVELGKVENNYAATIMKKVMELNPELHNEDVLIEKPNKTYGSIIVYNRDSVYYNYNDRVVIYFEPENDVMETIYINSSGERKTTRSSNLTNYDAIEIEKIGVQEDIYSEEFRIITFPVEIKKVTVDLPVEINSLYYAFAFTKSEKIEGLSEWDTSNIDNMQYTFAESGVFNEDISNWDTSNVTNMKAMFLRNKNFNQDISNWDTSNVTNMESMFNGSENFNQDISNWDASNVKTMDYIFYKTTVFGINEDIDLSIWNVDSVVIYQPFATYSAFEHQYEKWPKFK